ncbi:MAG TPA: helix-turn-helix transcriptional regulator [Reyranella sp.]|nr:helix-turn-helix transcriptional regulator [Reyranella sp.]
MNEFGRALRRWRRRRGVKQSHAAELFGVTQPTLSRWERGHQRLPEAAARRLEQLLAAPLDAAGDAGLRRLVESSALPVHLICDLTHRLLAASPARFAHWQVDAADLRGTSLWRFATEEIHQAESRLGALGWYDERSPELSFWTGANHDPVVPIEPGVLVWERLCLSDGTLARLVTSMPPRPNSGA